MRHGATRLLAVCFALAVCGTTAFGDEWSLPDSGLGIRTAPILLLSRKDVREHLRMTPEQTESARKMIEALRRKARATAGHKTDDRFQPAKLRDGASSDAIAARQAVDQEATEWIEANLSQEQRRRLIQIDLQWEGPSALVSRPFVSASLDLTADQQKTLSAARARYLAARRDGRDEMADLAQTTFDCLTPGQRETWKSLMGLHFPFPKPDQHNAASKPTK